VIFKVAGSPRLTITFYVRTILVPEYLAYTTYRPGEEYVDPETNETLGYEAEYIADNVIVNLGDPANTEHGFTVYKAKRDNIPWVNQVRVFNLAIMLPDIGP
jgi:hypothetical protein